MLNEYCIRATGSACYNSTGVTYPERLPVDWEQEILGGLLSPAPRWERQFGWSNQPHVLVFMADETEAQRVEARLDRDPRTHFRFIVRRKDW